MKIGEIGKGKGRLLLLACLQAAKSCLEQTMFWEGGFSPSQFHLFSPDAKHPEWRLSAAVPESDRSERSFDFNILQATAGTKLFRPAKQHPLLRVQGRTADDRLWRESHRR